MKKLIRRLVSDEQGIESIEYAVLGALIVVVIAVAVGALGTSVSDLFDDMVGAFPP